MGALISYACHPEAADGFSPVGQKSQLISTIVQQKNTNRDKYLSLISLLSVEAQGSWTVSKYRTPHLILSGIAEHHIKQPAHQKQPLPNESDNTFGLQNEYQHPAGMFMCMLNHECLEFAVRSSNS